MMHLPCVLLWSALATASSLNIFAHSHQRAQSHALAWAESKLGTEPYCYQGHAYNNYCCAESCGACGYFDKTCKALPGGEELCCGKKFKEECESRADTACRIPAEVVCVDMVGQYSCTNYATAQQVTASSHENCHQQCGKTQACVGGQYDADSGKCYLFGATSAEKECAQAVAETSKQSYVFTCEQAPWVKFSFKVKGLKHDALIASSNIRDGYDIQTRKAVEKACSEYADRDDVQLVYKADEDGNLIVEVALVAKSMTKHEMMRSALADAANLQVGLANAVAITPDISTAIDGTFEVIELTMPSTDSGTAEAPSSDLSSIVTRFGSLQQRINDLSSELVGLEVAVDSVSSEANSSSTAVQESLAAINGTVQAALRNRELAGQLNTQAANVTDMVAKAMVEVQRVQGILNTMEATAMGMDQQTTNLTSRLDGLKHDASMLLPGGKGGLLERLKEDEATLVQHWQDVKDTQAVDANITANLRANFRRSKDIVQNVTAELQANLTERLMSTVF